VGIKPDDPQTLVPNAGHGSQAAVAVAGDHQRKSPVRDRRAHASGEAPVKLDYARDLRQILVYGIYLVDFRGPTQTLKLRGEISAFQQPYGTQAHTNARSPLWYGIASTRSLDRSSAFMGGILYEGEGGEPMKARHPGTASGLFESRVRPAVRGKRSGQPRRAGRRKLTSGTVP
jgi:hypothetical protein